MRRVRQPAPSSRRAEANPRARQPESVTGRDNRWLKRFRAALSGHTETGDPVLGIEGLRLVEEAIRSAIPVEAILVSETGRKHLTRIARSLDPSMRLLATTDSVFENLAATETPQGIAALVRPRRASFDDLLQGTGAPLIVVLVGVQDPGNVGTILRAAEALGASGVAACRSDSLGTARVFSPKVARASAGAVFRLPVTEGLSSPVLQTQLRVAGVRILAATSSASDSGVVAPWEADLRGPIALFIGNEGAGLPVNVENAADARIRIPLAAVRGTHHESVESLNAATAAAVLLYEAARQRRRPATEFSSMGKAATS